MRPAFLVLAATVAFLLIACGNEPQCIRDTDCASGDACTVGLCSEAGECLYQHSSSSPSCSEPEQQYVPPPPEEDTFQQPFQGRILQPGEAYDRPRRDPPPPPEPPDDGPDITDPIPRPEPQPPCGPDATPNPAGYCG